MISLFARYVPYVRYKIVARKESAGVASIKLIYFHSPPIRTKNSAKGDIF